MSQVIEIVQRVEIPDFPVIELPYEDGEPLESNRQRLQIHLLVDSTRRRWPGRTDFFAGGNMFLYYSLQQARNRDFKGPDFFVVKNVDGTRDRKSWIVWEEDGRAPNVIVELLSPTTADEDLGAKKDIYEQRLRAPEYFCFAEDGALYGWHLGDGHYVPITPNEQGRLWSEELQAWLGPWQGEYEGVTAIWLRLFFPDGTLVPVAGEIAEAERQRAEAERQRAEAAEAEITRLRAALERLEK